MAVALLVAALLAAALLVAALLEALLAAAVLMALGGSRAGDISALGSSVGVAVLVQQC